MKIRFLHSGIALKVVAFLALGTASATLILPGCSGGNGGFGHNNNNNSPTETQRFNGTVNLGNNQSGALALRILSDNTARGTFTIANTTAQTTRAATATSTAAATVPFTTGVWNVTGTYNESTGRVQVSGNIPGYGDFSINVTPPTSTTSGSFVANFKGEEFNGTIPVVVATATPTTKPNATATPTNPPSSGGQVPLGNGTLAINLTSSNNSLSGGSVTTGPGSTAISDQTGNVRRINLVTNSGGLRLFNFLVTKQSAFTSGDNITISGTSTNDDIITLLVTNVSNPTASGVYRAQSGNFKITAVAGKKVSFTITNLRMVSETNSGQFLLNGDGSFTIN
jgi:hypothetical protein